MIWTVLWIAWGVMFAAVEGAALLSKAPGATLSEHIRAWLLTRDRKHRALSWVLRGLTIAFMVWLTGHFTLGWWPS